MSLVHQCDECGYYMARGERIIKVLITQENGAPFTSRTWCQACAERKVHAMVTTVIEGLIYRAEFTNERW